MPNTNDTQRSLRFFLVIFCLAVAALSVYSQNASLPAGQASEGIVTLVLNGATLGDLGVQLVDGFPIFPTADIRTWLSGSIKPDEFTRIFDQAFAGKLYLGVRELTEAGLMAEWDESNLFFSISIPPEYSPVKPIKLVKDPESLAGYVIKSAPISGVLNLNVQATSAFPSLSFSVPGNISADAAVNLFSFVLEGYGTMSWSSGGVDFSYQSARLVKDFKTLGLRLSGGLITPASFSYLSQPRLLGLSAQNFLAAARQTRTEGTISDFTITEPSILKIIVNGVVSQVMNLVPGNYKVSDLPIANGLNDFDIQIIGKDGGISSRKVVISSETGILEVGAADFSLAAGQSPSEWGQWFGNAYIRYGLLPGLTTSLFAQVDLRSVMAGGTFIAATPLGNVLGEGAVIHGWDGRSIPWAGAAKLEYEISFAGRSSLPNASVSAEYFSDGFVSPAPSSTVSDQDSSLRMGLSGGWMPTSSTSFSGGAYWTRTFLESPEDLGSFSFSIGQSIGSSAGLSLSANLSLSSTSSPEFDATLMLSITPQDLYTKSLSLYQSLGGTNNVLVSATAPIGNGINLDLNGTNLAGSLAEGRSLGIGANSSADFADFAMNGSLYRAEGTGAMSGNMTGSFSTAVVFAMNRVAITRRISDSFAILMPDKASLDYDVSFRTGFNEINQFMPHSHVMPLSSYRPTMGYVDLSTMSTDLSVNLPSAILNAGYRSGIAYPVVVIKSVRVFGKLVYADGTPAEMVVGDILDSNGVNIASTFTDENGAFEFYDMKPGLYKIEWPSYIGSSEIELEARPDGMFDIGDIVSEGLPPAG